MDAIAFIHARLGFPEEFTTLDIWNKGHEMVEAKIRFPAQTKMSFKGLKNKEALASTIRMHPSFMKSHRITSHKAGGRTTAFLYLQD